MVKSTYGTTTIRRLLPILYQFYSTVRISIRCESYIDDVFIHAQTKEQFFERISLVFERFRKFRIIINHDKLFISDIFLEFTGHEITPQGIKFSEKKLSGVENMPPPKTKGEMKKFLGLANYFRDHVKNESILAAPLQRMIPNYKRGERSSLLKWSDELLQNYIDLNKAVVECPMLYFINEEWKIGLETDASDYGIGGFLFQTDPDKKTKVPIQFVSKSLTGPQLNWSTPEKEAYAKYFTVKKLEYILGDREFTWWTDHKNNAIIARSTGSDKVLRWDLFLQQFDMKREYIKGDDNEISDSLSRLCAVSDKTQYLTLLEENEVNTDEYLNVINETTLLQETMGALAEPRILNDETFNILTKVHNSYVGHLGVERTLKRLKRENNTWEGMRLDIMSFIKACPCCQKMSRIKVPILTSPFTTASYGLGMKLSMDCIGPLTETDDGFTHILAIIDNFSRYIGLYALTGASADEVAHGMMTHIGIFGCPQIIQTDNGNEFDNQIIEELVKLIGTESKTILAYSKEENSIVERSNRETMRHIKAMVFELNKRNSWNKYLPIAQRIMNSEVSTRIGVSPNDLVFGGKLNLQKYLIHATKTKSVDVSIAKWSAEMLSVQEKLVQIAQTRQQEQDESHMRKGLKNEATGGLQRNITEFRHGSFVLIQYPSSLAGKAAPPTKLHSPWYGPMRVISNIGAEYLVHDLIKDKQKLVHVTRMKAYNHDERAGTPLNIAARDNEETEIESILQHLGDPKKKSTLDFLVHWKGYDTNEDLWLPWKELRLNPILHEYLKANKMKHLIPKPFLNIINIMEEVRSYWIYNELLFEWVKQT